MQTKLISAAVAALFVAAPAFAATPAFNTANTNEFYVSGASAQEGQLKQFMRRACTTGTLTLYRQANQFAYHCAVNTAVTGAVTKANSVVYKSSVGGSGNGTEPVANNKTLAFMDVATMPAIGSGGATTAPAAGTCSNATTVAAVAPVGTDTIGLPAYQDVICNQTLVNKTTEAGLSDVEPALFKGSVAGLDDAAIAKLGVAPINQLVFGVPVTTGLRDALQTAQVANGTLAAGCVGSETEACMPSLTKSQITGIYTGTLSTWDQLGLTNAADPYNAVWTARRVQTSGTQTSARVYFLNDPCVANMASFVEDPAGPLATTNAAACSAADPIAAGYTPTFQGSGSGNVVTCMNAHQTNNRWAVGVLSTEFVAGSAGNTGYRFIKVDGSAPTLYNAANGNYQYVMEATLQKRVGATNPTAGDDLVMYDAMVAGFNSPAVVAAIDTGMVQLYGNGGILGVPGANLPDNPITTAGIVTNPVSAYTHSNSGSTNNCQPLQPTQPGSTTGAF
jgi:ABC-type phosphate transport system substrate-binding protein